MSEIFWTEVETPIGSLLLAGTASALRTVRLPGNRLGHAPEPEWVFDPRPLRAAKDQLTEFFAGRRRQFELSLEPIGTAFQLTVWRALEAIPFGTTVSYAELARRIGRPEAVRAVGLANGANPLPIVVPCHRVIGSDGSLTGYGGGLELKRALLALEGALPRGEAGPARS
jgi:methylated-DNA-[protein]-cysteine S-methyltransferase